MKLHLYKIGGKQHNCQIYHGKSHRHRFYQFRSSCFFYLHPISQFSNDTDGAAAVAYDFAELFDVIVHHALISVKVVASEAYQELIAAVDASRIFQEKQKHIVFLRGKL